MFWLLVQDSIDQVLDCEELLYFMPELVGLGSCSFAFCLKFGTLRLPGFYGKCFIVSGKFALG